MNVFDFQHTLENCKLGLPETMKWFEDSFQSMHLENDISIPEDYSQDIFGEPDIQYPEYNFDEELQRGLAWNLEDTNLVKESLNVWESTSLGGESKDYPAVILQQAEDDAPEPLPHIIKSSPTIKYECSMKSDDDVEDIESTIQSILYKLKAQQQTIDEGNYQKNGPGRKRKFGPKTSKQLRTLVMGYLRKHFAKIISNKRCKDRKDALITIFIRWLKKLTYHLVEQCAAKNMYKKNETSNFIVAFSESHSSFLFSINKFDEVNLVESFIEYMVIYFPLDKARKLIKSMIKQNSWSQDFLQMQLEILEHREVTSKKNIKKWTENSPTFKMIFELALEVLEEDQFVNTRIGIYLTNATRYFL